MELTSLSIRKRILKMAFECGRSVHLGGSLSMVEILTVLYRDVLKYDSSDPSRGDRDRFVLSKGHCVMALYAVLAEIGLISEDEIADFMNDGSSFGSHPVMDLEHGIECSSGSLGQGISLALGLAKATKLKKENHRIYTLVGNGECDEGSVWESLMLAGQWKLDNFTVIMDHNRLQSDGDSCSIIDMSDMVGRLSGFDLSVYAVDGHNEDEIKQALDQDPEGMTKVIICNTVKGKGISFLENNNEWHHNRLIRETYEEAMKELEA